MNYQNRKQYLGKININYCFIHNTERHIAILMNWDGKKYILESAWNISIEKKCFFKIFPYRKPLGLLKRIDELVKEEE